MRFTSRWTGLIAVALGMLAWAAQTNGAIPGAKDPKARTKNEFMRDRERFWHRLFVDSYNAVGKRNPRWDAQVIKLLDAEGRAMSVRGVEGLHYNVEAPTGQELAKLAKQCISAGCDDPLVQLFNGVFLPNRQEGRAKVESAVNGLIERKYPDFVVAMGARTMLVILDRKDQAAIARYREMNWDRAISGLSGKLSKDDLRFAYVEATTVLEESDLAARLTLIHRIEKSKEADPWLLNVLKGEYEIEAAWKARGDGFANEVTPQGWTDFFDHLTTARDLLTKAHALHPEFPEAATAMISVAMGAGSRINEKQRDWFDKAVTAQLDYGPAYDKYVWSLYPRWGGSYPEMLRFGLECLASDRYDTDVPMHFLTILTKVDGDSTNDLSVYKIDQVQKALNLLLDQYSKKAPSERARNYFTSYHAALFLKLGLYKEAETALAKVGDHPDLRAFGLLDMWPPAAMSEIRAMNSPNAQALQKAAEQLQDGDVDAAIMAYQNVLSGLAKDDPARLFVSFRAKSLELQRGVQKGDWVDIQPTAAFAPWAVSHGDFKIDKEGAVVATAGANGLAILLCRVDFLSDYEITAKVQSPDPKHPARALILVESNDDVQNCFGVDPAKNEAIAGVNGSSTAQIAKLKNKLEATAELHVWSWHSLMRGYVNDAEVEFGTLRMPPAQRGNAFVGIALTGGPGAVARFSEIKIRKIGMIVPGRMKPKDE